MHSYKRMRPHLGTLLEISVQGDSSREEINEAMSLAFFEAERLEQLFSKFIPHSELRKFNSEISKIEIPVSAEFYSLCSLATILWKESEGAFNPFFPQTIPWKDQALIFSKNQTMMKLSPLELDLNGMAKGFIVDQLVNLMQKRIPASSGCINAGGDLRFWGHISKRVQLRLGPTAAPLYRALESTKDAVASTAPIYAHDTPESNTRYKADFRSSLSHKHSVSVLANACGIADALTKLAFYGSEQLIRSCAKQFSAQFLIFNELGELEESYGDA